MLRMFIYSVLFCLFFQDQAEIKGELIGGWELVHVIGPNGVIPKLEKEKWVFDEDSVVFKGVKYPYKIIKKHSYTSLDINDNWLFRVSGINNDTLSLSTNMSRNTRHTFTLKKIF